MDRVVYSISLMLYAYWKSKYGAYRRFDMSRRIGKKWVREAEGIEASYICQRAPIWVS